MLMRLSHDLGLYFYDVVVARFDLWAAFGVIAQFVFGARFLVQWIASEKAEKSVIPVGFWFLSISRRADDPGLWFRPPRPRDHSRPGFLDLHLHPQPDAHRQGCEAAQGEGRGVSCSEAGSFGGIRSAEASILRLPGYPPPAAARSRRRDRA